MSVSEPDQSNRPSPPGVTTVLAAFLGTALVAGVVAAGMMMPAIGGMAALANTAIDSFESFPTKLSDPVLPQRSVIVDAKGRRIAYIWEENRISVPLNRIAPVMQQAIVAIEDARYYEHNGVDLRGTARAFFTNQEAGEIQQGGSTITQQYVKLIQLNNARTKAQERAATERTPERKLREARYAIAMEKRKTKGEILDGYLNIAYFGSGAYGVEVAAQTYFGKHASELNLLESATLAGAVNKPSAFDPIRAPKSAQARRNLVLSRMRQLGYISQQQYAKAVKIPLKSYVRPRFLREGCPTAKTSDAYFCDYVLNYIRNEPTFGNSRAERTRLLETGGLVIQTTLEPKAQYHSFDSVTDRIPIGDWSHKASAISMVEPGTGRVIAMAQNTKWGTKGRGRTAYNYNVRLEDGGTIGFQSGSSFKVFTLAAALEKGISPYTSIYAPGIRTFYGFEDCNGYTFPPYTVRNASTSEAGTFDMYTGTAHSVNTFFIGLEQMVSLCRQAELAESMGVRRGDGRQLNRVPSFALGANEVVPLDMAGAYAAFENGGVWCKPNPVQKITTLTGRAIYNMKPQCRRVLSESVAATMTSLLRGPVSSVGTAPEANFGRDIAGKTGTTDSSSAVWFAGYTSQIAAAVWVGDPRGGYQYPLNNVVINGIYYGQVFGATIPAPIWRDAMNGAHRGMPYRGLGGKARNGWIKLDLEGRNTAADNARIQRQREPAASAPPTAPTPTPKYNLDKLDDLSNYDFG